MEGVHIFNDYTILLLIDYLCKSFQTLRNPMSPQMTDEPSTSMEMILAQFEEILIVASNITHLLRDYISFESFDGKKVGKVR